MKIRKDDILLILLSLLFASCRVGKAEPVADPMEEEGISVVRYDKLLDEYVRFNSFSAWEITKGDSGYHDSYDIYADLGIQ